MTPDRVVFKYTNWVKERGNFVIEAPLGKVVLVATQNPTDSLPTLWIEHFLSPHPDEIINQVDLQRFRLIGTGHKSIDPREEHVGSCICAHGALVWHIYKVVS